jgi:membrane associated rhomboid family serine protease
MLILPYKADAPVDYRPWGTVALIACNVLVAILLGFPEGPGGNEPFVNALTLKYGTVQPWTWIPCAFVHFDWGHLGANMIFLWSFGLVAEGLVGWRRFVPLYLAIGATVSVLMQFLMLAADGGQAAGASGAIYGIMAVGALWAPRNTFSTFLWILVLVRFVELSVLTLALIYIGIDLFFAMIRGFSMSSEVAHLLGAGAGFAFGILMLRKGWVDTGGWDWFALRRGRAAVRPERTAAQPPPTPVSALVRVRDALELGQPAAANDAYSVAQAAAPAFVLPRADLDRLAAALADFGAAEAAAVRFEESLRAYPEGAIATTLSLAGVLLRARRPRAALDRMAALDHAPLSEAQRATKSALESDARNALGATGLELE